MSAEITASDFSDIRWKGHWIWVPEHQIEVQISLGGPSSLPEPSHGLFRKAFVLETVPDRVPALRALRQWRADLAWPDSKPAAPYDV